MDDDQVVAAAERALRPAWPDVALTDGTALDGSDRSRVLRCRVAGAPVDTVVVKSHRTADGAPEHERESAVREAAALSLLVGHQGVVQLLGVAEDPPTLVLADLGAAGDVAEALLGPDPQVAAAGVAAWATAIARLHSTGVGRDQLEPALVVHAARLGLHVPPVEATPRMLERAGEQLAEHAPRLGVRPTSAALEELRSLDDLLGGGPDARTLTPSDACPDNNALVGGAAVLLDFEGAQVRHIAWDAVYLMVPWPSCWCSWRLDAGVARRALAIYRAAVDISYARTSAFDDDLRAVAAGWALVSTGWFLESALGEEHSHPGHAAVMPHRRAMISHRLALVHEPRLPALTALAGELLAAARTTWGDVPLELAPAFRGR